jgi:hypothetical protein
MLKLDIYGHNGNFESGTKRNGSKKLLLAE